MPDRLKEWMKPQVLISLLGVFGLSVVAYYRVGANEVRNDKDHSIYQRDHDAIIAITNQLGTIRGQLDKLIGLHEAQPIKTKGE